MRVNLKYNFLQREQIIQSFLQHGCSKVILLLITFRKSLFSLIALCGKTSSVTSSVVSSSGSVCRPGERPQRTEVFSLTSCGVGPHGSQWPRKQLVPLSLDQMAISSFYLRTARLVLGTMEGGHEGNPMQGAEKNSVSFRSSSWNRRQIPQSLRSIMDLTLARVQVKWRQCWQPTGPTLSPGTTTRIIFQYENYVPYCCRGARREMLSQKGLQMRSPEAQGFLASSELASIRRQSRKESFYGSQVKKVFPRE